VGGSRLDRRRVEILETAQSEGYAKTQASWFPVGIVNVAGVEWLAICEWTPARVSHGAEKRFVSKVDGVVDFFCQGIKPGDRQNGRHLRFQKEKSWGFRIAFRQFRNIVKSQNTAIRFGRPPWI